MLYFQALSAVTNDRCNFVHLFILEWRTAASLNSAEQLTLLNFI